MVAKGEFKCQQEDDHPGDILLGYVLKSLRSRVLGQSALNPLLDETEKALHATFPKGAIIRLKGLLSEVPDELTCEQDCLSLTDRILDMIEEEERKESEQKANNPNGSPSGQDIPGGQPGESGGGVTSPSLGQVGNTAENQGNDPDQDSQASSPSPGQGNGDGNDAGSGEDNGGKPAKPSSPTPESPSGSDGGSHSTGNAANSVSGKPGNGSGGQDDGDDPQFPDRNGLVQKILNTTDDELEPDMFDTVKDLLKIDASQETTICLPNGEEPPRNDAFGMSLYRKAEGESGVMPRPV